MTFSTYARVEREIAGHLFILETGQVARQALGSIIATLGETKVFSAVAQGPGRPDQDFFPLTVDYREKTEAAGKIPGGFFKREGRPTTKEILTMRLTDRSIRPLFAEGFKDEVQVMSHALCYDGVNNADVLSMIAAFAAVHISGLPFHGAMGAVRVGYLDGQLVAFPPDDRRREESRLDLVVAGHKNAICMVEASAKQVSEAEMIDALEFAHSIIKQIAEMCDELCSKAGKPRQTFKAPEADAEISAAVEPLALVPATCTQRIFCWGLPSRAHKSRAGSRLKTVPAERFIRSQLTRLSSRASAATRRASWFVNDSLSLARTL